MESKQQAPSVILNLMGLDKGPAQHPVRDKQKVLSENYLQKVASIGVRKRRSSHQHHSFGINTNEKEECEDVLKVVKAMRQGRNHNPSKGNGKENPSSCNNSHLADGLLQEIFYPKSTRVYPEVRGRNKISYRMNFGKQSSRSFNNFSEWISMQSGNVANRVLGTASRSFFRGNEAFYSDMLKPASNISVHEVQCSSPFFCSVGSCVDSEERNKTLEQRDVSEKLRELGRCGQDCTSNKFPIISEHGNGGRNLTHRSGYSNDKIKMNIRCKVGVNYSFARRVPRPLCATSVVADNCETMNQDILFQRYWGLRKNASANWSSWKSKNPNINQKECLEDVNLSPGQEKFPSLSSYFNNHTEENFIGHMSENRCYENDLSDKITMPPQLSSSSPSPALLDSYLQERCLMNDEVKNKIYEDTNISKQNVVSPDSSIEFLVSDPITEVDGRSHNNPTIHQYKSTSFTLSQEIDSLSHTSYASKQQDTSDFQEDSVHSLSSEADPGSLSSFEEAYGPSPISVLDPLFGEDIPFSYKCGNNVYDSSEVDDEEFGLNVSSDDDCGNKSVGDSEEKKDIAKLFRIEESRDFSYVVEVLTEAGVCNRSLFTDVSAWHSAECPISPSVFEILEKKFGEQQLWKRSERKLLFDRIKLGLLEILQPYLYIPIWEKPMSRRLNAEPSQDIIEEELWGLLVAQEKKSSKQLADNMLGGEIRWIELVEDVEDIVREIVKLLVEELANEIVSLEYF